MRKIRNFKYDNLKALLIFLVVFGHLLEPLAKTNAMARLIYIFIYIFHMPAFIYIMGKFVRPNLKRIKKFFLLYFPFQIIYTLFMQYFGFENEPLTLFTPQWILWFLFASIAYNILTNNEETEESVSDTYMAAWKAIPPQRPSNLATFIGFRFPFFCHDG